LSPGTPCGAAAIKRINFAQDPKQSQISSPPSAEGDGKEWVFYYARYCMKIFRTLSINFIDRKEIIANDFNNQE